MIRMFRFLIALFCIAFAAEARAVTASPHPVEELQPDGSVIELRMQGDEHAHWAEDADGFTVVRDRGWFEGFHYASSGLQRHLLLLLLLSSGSSGGAP